MLDLCHPHILRCCIEVFEAMEEKPMSYVTALRRYGLKFYLRYLLETHFFDIRYSIETKERIYPSDFKEKVPNLEHGKAYMPAWTSEIKKSFYYFLNNLENLNEFTFFDIGCGKGKVLIVWRLLAIKQGLNLNAYGVDYYGEVIRRAKDNYKKVFGVEGNFIEADAALLSYRDYGEKNIFFLYNPFDQFMLDKFLAVIDNQDAYVIYNNPQHTDELSKHGFKIIYENDEGIQSLRTLIFHRANT